MIRTRPSAISSSSIRQTTNHLGNQHFQLLTKPKTTTTTTTTTLLHHYHHHHHHKMHTTPHVAIGSAASIPVPPSTPIISISPVVIPAPDRPVDLEVRVTIPAPSLSTSATTSPSTPLPVLILSHGHGRSNYLSSLEGYAPLSEFYAAHGFAVLQPTHLSSAFLALPSEPGNELHYKSRPTDISHLISSLHLIESALSSPPFTTTPTTPGIALSRTAISIVGHSFGAWTASLLLGASNTDPRPSINPTASVTTHVPDARIKAGVILAGIGAGGSNISPGPGPHISPNPLIPFYNGSFSKMTTPALIVYGDEDVSPHLTTRGADWHGDAYRLSPGPKDLMVVKGAKHGLGGISGWDAGETLDESPERLAIVQRMTWAYLWSQLHEGDGAWERACEALRGEGLGDKAVVESKK